ncbi:uncharacterized protein LOC9641780 [Selaginella moellendorffii]|nr:uncharacterized protein LOC9641780 [Selaginella moellendorffii]|eukprot:XP_002960943.2 uncharacterized protein LOC9641780 [Selaginella moellendorffii]
MPSTAITHARHSGPECPPTFRMRIIKGNPGYLSRRGQGCSRVSMSTKSWQVRVQRDLTELTKEPLQGIQVCTYADQLDHMCLVLSPLSGPYAGVNLHLDVRIPADYPHGPPQVTIQTPVRHPNVFGSFICCDILKPVSTRYDYNPQGGHWQIYNGGYTPGYLLKYLFLQLLSFFSSKFVQQDYGGKAVELESYSQREHSFDPLDPLDWVKRYSCANCGFNVAFPGVKSAPESTSVTSPAMIEGEFDDHLSLVESPNLFERLDADCCLEIVDRLSDQDAIRLTRVYSGVKELINSENLLLRRQLVCFFLRKTFKESDTVLGIGVSCPAGGGKPFVAAVDLLSYEAFKSHGVRKGITGEDFDYFLPLVLDEDHFQRARPLIDDSLKSLALSFPRKPTASAAPISVVLQTLPALMNTMVFTLVQSCDRQKSELSNHTVVHASEKALQGYCLLFHLFSKLVREHHYLRREIQRKVDAFISNIECRGKDHVPDLGEFLTYLLVAPNAVEWDKVCGLFLGEILTRNTLWALQKKPYLAYVEPDNFPSEVRLQHTFEANADGLRLVMFQICFFRMTRSTNFDQRYGFPSGEMSSQLLQTIKDIYSVKAYDVFLRIFGFPVDPAGWKWNMIKLLKQAIVSSEKKGYHVFLPE